MPRDTPPRHPKSARLAAFFLAQVKGAERNEIIQHLFGGCEPCRAKIREWLEVDESLPPKMARRSPKAAYDFVLKKAAALARAADAARRRALQDIEPLLGGEPGRHPVIAWARARACSPVAALCGVPTPSPTRWPPAGRSPLRRSCRRPFRALNRRRTTSPARGLR